MCNTEFTILLIIGVLTLNLCYTFKEGSYFLVLYLIQALACTFTFMSTNIYFIYLLLEIQTYAVLIILTYEDNSVKISESSLKYFMLNGITSIFFLVGMVIMSTNDLVFSFNNFLLFGENTFDRLSPVLIFLAMTFKFGMVPFHFWLLDIYESCSWHKLSLITAIPKLTYLTIILRLFMIDNMILVIGVLSLIIGTIGAFNQNNLRRLLGYSAISQSGFFLIILLIPDSFSICLSMCYYIIYMLSFLIILYGCNKLNIKNSINELSSVKYVSSPLRLIMTINFLSLAGFPPLSGFITKWYIISSFVIHGSLFISGLLIFCSIISMGYYLRLIKIMYFDAEGRFYSWGNNMEAERNDHHWIKTNVFSVLDIFPYIVTLFIVFLFISPDLFFSVMDNVCIFIFN